MEMLYYNAPDKEIVMYTNDLKGFFGERAAENRPLGGLADLMMEERGARLIQNSSRSKRGKSKMMRRGVRDSMALMKKFF